MMQRPTISTRRPANVRQPWPIESGRERTVPVILITPRGIEHLSFTDGDRVLISLNGGRLTLQVG